MNTTMRCLVAALSLAGLTPVSWSDTTLSRSVGATTVHVGITPLAQALQRVGPDAAQVMHGSKRSGRNAQHLVVALVDRSSGAHVADADVTVTVADPGYSEQAKPLHRMTTGGMPSYGNTFDMKPGTSYAVRVSVRRRDEHGTMHTSFDVVQR